MTRLAFLGTPQMAVPPLQALIEQGPEHGWVVSAVVTRADAKRGRGGALTPSPVKQVAIDAGIPVHHRVDDLLGTGIDLGVVVAFGQLIKAHVLAEIPMINLHFSLLPRWRGAAPVERALLAGDAVTGVSLMQLDVGLDTGPVYEMVEVPIHPTDSADDLRGRLVHAGTGLLIHRLSAGLGVATQQAGDATYATKISPDELRIDWSRPVAEIDRLIRLGGAWTTLHGKRLKIHRATVIGDQSGDRLNGAVVGGLRLERVQPEGKAAMDFADFARGARLADGEQLGG